MGGRRVGRRGRMAAAGLLVVVVVVLTACSFVSNVFDPATPILDTLVDAGVLSCPWAERQRLVQDPPRQQSSTGCRHGDTTVSVFGNREEADIEAESLAMSPEEFVVRDDLWVLTTELEKIADAAVEVLGGEVVSADQVEE
jgi:hypothetical protein